MGGLFCDVYVPSWRGVRREWIKRILQQVPVIWCQGESAHCWGKMCYTQLHTQLTLIPLSCHSPTHPSQKNLLPPSFLQVPYSSFNLCPPHLFSPPLLRIPVFHKYLWTGQREIRGWLDFKNSCIFHDTKDNLIHDAVFEWKQNKMQHFNVNKQLFPTKRSDWFLVYNKLKCKPCHAFLNVTYMYSVYLKQDQNMAQHM